MIISDQKKFIFLHNPKCAGTTVRKKLMPHEDRNNYYWMFDEILGYRFDKAHMSLSTFRSYCNDDFKLLDEYFTFGFVRNPFSRVISSFSETNMRLYNEYTKGLNVEHYIDKLNNYCLSLNKQNTKGNSPHKRHAIQQNRIFYIGGKCKADLIIKIEDIDCGLRKLKALNPTLHNLLSDINKNKKNVKPINKKYHEILTKESIDNIHHVYETDFLLFNYNE